MADTTITGLPTASGIDGSVDWLAIDRTSLNTTQKINRNTFLGVTGQPMDISSSQNVTNKTLDNTNTVTLKDTLFTLQDDGDTTKQARFQLSGITTATTRTYTLPNASSTLVDLSTAQTLTNKTLTGPVITGGSVTGTTITTDAIVGQSASTSGTIYGLSVSSAKISGTSITNSTITSTQIATGGVSAANLATSAIKLGYTQITSDFVSTSVPAVQITGMTSTVTVPNGGRGVKITVWCGSLVTSTGAGYMNVTIWDGTVGSGTQLTQSTTYTPANQGQPLIAIAFVTPSAGSKTYNVGLAVSAGTGNFQASATAPAFILVEAI